MKTVVLKVERVPDPNSDSYIDYYIPSNTLAKELFEMANVYRIFKVELPTVKKFLHKLDCLVRVEEIKK